MRHRVHFYSTYDMSIYYHLQKTEEIISKYHSGWRPSEVNDVIELYNIWLFVHNKVYNKGWSEETLNEIREYKETIIPYFAKLDKNTWVSVYLSIEFDYRHFFWEIIDRFNIKLCVNQQNLKEAITKNAHELCYLLQRERLVKQYDKELADLLKENNNTAEWLLGEFVEDDRSYQHKHIYFPLSLTIQERENIIVDYLDRPEPNLNYVRLILVAKKDSNLRLSDDVILKAKQVERRLNNKYLKGSNSFHFAYTVCLSEDANKPLKWIEYDKEGNAVFCYSEPIMLGFKDSELLHFCSFGFEFLTYNGMISLITKTSESGIFERFMGITGKYSYPTNMAFRYQEAISMLQIESIQTALKKDGRSLEDAIKVFYESYLKEKYGYPSTKLSLPDNSADWVSKCRVIAPEIDAIAKRYHLYAKRGTVDEELLQISSDTVRVSSALSCNSKKYYSIKGRPGELYRLFHLFFSDQCMLSFVDPFKEKHYSSFFEMLKEQDGKIPYENYENYQRGDIDYLIEVGYLSISEDGKIGVEKKMEISILKQLYEYHSCPVLKYADFGQDLLQQMLEKGWLEEDNHLLSIEERNYFDYYLYNTPFTNGPALRNRYVHGTSGNPDENNKHKSSYCRLLILLILELLKIEDDLIDRESNKANKEKDIIDNHFMIGKVADVRSFSSSMVETMNGNYISFPKTLGYNEGYTYVDRIDNTNSPAYIAFVKGSVLSDYITFIINSSLFRLFLSNNGTKKTHLTIEKIRSIILPDCDMACQSAFGRLELLIAELKITETSLTREERLQLDVLTNLRDYLCLELLKPDFKDITGIEFIAPFLEMMQRLDGKSDNMRRQMTDILFKSGNILMDNMKKARSIINQRNQ